MQQTLFVLKGLQLLVILAAVGPLAACTPILAATVGTGSYQSSKPAKSSKQRAVAPRSKAIPPGHLPPAGQCRIWFADRPPGQQPPSGNCNKLRKRVPPGASLIYG